MSDHGHRLLKDRFYLNRWLEREGALVRRRDRSATGRLARLGLHRDRLNRWTAALGVREVARRVVPEATRRALPDAEGRAGPLGLARHVDARRSLAVSPGTDQVYLRQGYYPFGLVRRLRELRHPDTGDRVFTRVVRAHKAWASDWPAGPDLLLEPNGYEVYYTLPEEDEVWDSRLAEPRARWRSVHERDGVFVAAGPDLRRGATVDVGLVDVVPTMLHALGLAVPADADGRVVRSVFDPESEAAGRAVARREYAKGPGGEAAAVDGKEERLRALGYLA